MLTWLSLLVCQVKERRYKFLKELFNPTEIRQTTSKGTEKLRKKQFNCYVCGIPGHKAYQCFKRHGQQQSNTKPAGQAINHANLAKLMK